MSLWRPIDRFIDQMTMYRLMRHYLADLLIAAFILSLFGVLQYNPFEMLGATLILLAACYLFNLGFAWLFKAPSSSDSFVITAFILALIITPSLAPLNIVFLIAAAGIAMASKYLMEIRFQHIFNPAAFAVVATAYGAGQTASWWVGTPAMAPLALIGGVLVARKVRRGGMVLMFFAVTAVATALFSWLSGGNVVVDLKHMALSSAVLFLGFVMLTEPQTSPTTQGRQLWYAALVGALLPPQVRVFSFYSSPELALLVGNVFSYIVSAKRKLVLHLKEKLQVAAHTYDFIFTPAAKLAYQPGQYMEWTLPHPGVDKRGDRRYFTLASSPTEPELRLGVKFYDKGSTFKQTLLALDAKIPVVAAQLAGDFTLPKATTRKIAFIAGGIGITPFRSMVKYLLDTNDSRSVVLLYSASTQADIAYAPLFETARKKIKLKTIYVITGGQAAKPNPFTYQGRRIDAELIKTEIPDYAERTFYISGTHTMVEAMEDILQQLGVESARIKTDFFPGYV